MLKFFEKVFGSKREKDVEELVPVVDEINAHFEGLHDLTDDELRGKTEEFRSRLREAIGEIEDEASELRERLKEDVPHEERLQIIERVGELN